MANLFFMRTNYNWHVRRSRRHLFAASAPSVPLNFDRLTALPTDLRATLGPNRRPRAGRHHDRPRRRRRRCLRALNPHRFLRGALYAIAAIVAVLVVAEIGRRSGL